MSKHTPGPWLVDCGYIYAACQMDENGMTRQRPLAEVTGDQDHEDHYYENCRLIAAAPDLLEALELADCLLSGANMNRAVVERKVRAAIAKATGEKA